ncbi:MAG: FHA domain-containing protein, partial [Planctomycetota bacterium]
MNEQGRDPEFVHLGDRPVEVGRSSDATLRLFHPTVSRNHATLTHGKEGIDVVDRDILPVIGIVPSEDFSHTPL